MSQSLVDSGSLGPVKNLRSRFENPGLDNPILPLSRKQPDYGLLVPEATSPRPRAASGSASARPDTRNLRSASSSSDLKTTAKRSPPPPPPPRGSAQASPLLRPVPSPASSSPSIPLVSLDDGEGDPEKTSVASLRSMFSQSASPRPSGHSRLSSTSSLYSVPATGSVSSLPPLDVLVNNNTASNSPSSTSSPPIPPRIGMLRSPPKIPTSSSMTSITTQSSSTSSSPFLDSDSEPSASQEVSVSPPPIPLRMHQRDRSTGSENEGMKRVPPAPPLQATRIGNVRSTDAAVASPTTLHPPPLPVRRNTTMVVKEIVHKPAPRLPVRQATLEATSPSSPIGTSPRRMFEPPPTRTIGLGDKLPPARRPQTPSSEDESGDEPEDKGTNQDTLPDSSRSSRKPPVVSCFNYSALKVHVTAYSGHVAVAGHFVVVSSKEHVKVFDLSHSDSPVFNLDANHAFGVKEARVTSLEFRADTTLEATGSHIWLGTREGHLIEVDVKSGQMTASKPFIHGHPVTHIMRHRGSMLTIDDAGKLIVFPADKGHGVRLAYAQPRVLRIAEKQEFVKMLGGLLWTSARSDSNHPVKTPIVRVYDVDTPGAVGRSMMPCENVGAVTSGAVLHSQPNHVYLGHEGGFVSIWSLEGEDGAPKCVEVQRVSTSDVLSLDGINDRLWAGGRKGQISAYDVSHKPWVMTNCWMAHDGLPVMKLQVDPFSIDKVGRLCAYSVGRDEQLRFWDGLLGVDWIDKKLLQRETEFSRFRDLNVLIVSWNIDASKPDALTQDGDTSNLNFLHDVLSTGDAPDIIAFGFQEVVDLESRKMTAKSVLLGKKKEEGRLSDRVTGAYKRWHDALLLAVRLAMPANAPYTVVHTENLVGLFSCIFVRNTERIALKDVSIKTIKRGMGGHYGNKGGILARFVIDDSSICLINCHLAAGQNHVRQRNADIAAFLEEKSILPASDALEDCVAYVGGGDGSMVLDHEIVFIAGDMNYRIDQRRDPVIAAVKSGELETLFVHDQLLKEMKFNRGFRLRPFSEGPITFAPTYKYDRRSDEFDSSEKRRTPAWCDRILWKSSDPARVRQLEYRRWEANVSDHRPVSARFVVTVKSVRQEVRANIKAEVGTGWLGQQDRLLEDARDFYVDQGML